MVDPGTQRTDAPTEAAVDPTPTPPPDGLPDRLADHVPPDLVERVTDEVHDLVVVANRLPVDRVGTSPDGAPLYQRSPGGLVTALEPVMRSTGGAWIGWPGSPGVAGEPFEAEGIRLVPVALSAQEVRDYYEGFSNSSLWPLYHDVIAQPVFHRSWWDAYVAVNERFAEVSAEHAHPGATVWVQDYQLQLVPGMLRERRPDLRIGFFNHIPFPGFEIFSQLPWRRAVVDGILGADLVGFQRRSDASNFLRACRRTRGLATRASRIGVRGADGDVRVVRAEAFPISIDAGGFESLARRPEVQQRAKQIREELGNPETLLLGVDRLDYTKGIMHRLKAYAECLEDGLLDPATTVLVQVASPSRERVDAYRMLRDEVELTVGRINGDHGAIGRAPVHYLHQSFPREEMAALYLAADVMLVTALRDGMNLVAKEYVAARHDEDGVLVLSEFAGAADELGQALLVNPHDIDGLKDVISRSARMAPAERRRRMRSMRRRVAFYDVQRWGRTFLGALAMTAGATSVVPTAGEATDESTDGSTAQATDGAAGEGTAREGS
jgi:alpha,alpha-trehalose-phosphate synthase [UDP-forming]